MKPDLPITGRTRLRRLRERGAHDRASMYAILDAGLMCHVGYVLEGKPVVTPTAYWREGDHVYWHGSAASRMLRAVDGAEVCLTVSHLDALVLARSAFHHSVDYRSVMIFGRAAAVSDPGRKRAVMDAFIERLYPGRSRVIRTGSDKELAAIAVMSLAIEEASAKVRAAGVIDDEEDYALPVWAGVIRTQTTIGPTIPDGRLIVTAVPPHAAIYAENAVLDTVLTNCAIAAEALEK
jgi:uncharacterized protein